MSRVVGSRLARPDGPGKVAGTTRYVADLRFAGEWVGGTVRSNVARGRLEAIERDPGFDFGRVVVVGPEDVPGANVIEMLTLDQPALASRAIEHFGEPLLLVAAPDEATLQAALAALRPRITPLEPVLDPRQSTKVFKEIRIEKGDVERALVGAVRTFEGEYETATQEQLYIEPQGVIALPPDEQGVVTVHGSLQCPYYVQKTLMRALGLPAERVRVVQEATGGGFGGKEDYPSILATHAALLARKAARPVRMIYDRHEDLAFTPKRHPSRVRIRSGVDGEGRLVALDIDVLFDGGAYTTLSPVVLSRGCIHAAGPYRCEHVRIHGRAVATNHVPYGAFRGFGAPQTCFAIERHMDRIAAELGVHPFELRRRNALKLGDSHGDGTAAEGERRRAGGARTHRTAHAVRHASVARTAGFAQATWVRNELLLPRRGLHRRGRDDAARAHRARTRCGGARARAQRLDGVRAGYRDAFPGDRGGGAGL
jgi:CO/xanthine dehydrogenase Mo-binding subunit